MDPIVGSLIAGVGGQLLGGLFGGSNVDPNQTALFAKYNQVLKEQLQTYYNTDLEAQDRATLANFSQLVGTKASQILSAYQGSLNAQGNTGKDTETTRSKAAIAKSAGTDVAQLKTTLDTTRADRKNALLPSTAGMPQLAANLDAGQQAQKAAYAQSFASIGSALTDALKYKPSSASVATAPASTSAPINLANPGLAYQPATMQTGLTDYYGRGGKLTLPSFAP